MRVMAVCGLGVALVAAGVTTGAQQPAAAHSAGWAIFSPQDAESLRGAAESAPGKLEIRTADRLLDSVPKPMAKVHTEGALPGQGIRDESGIAKRDWVAALNLAFAFRLTGDEKYAATTDRFLGAWTAVYTTSLNPIDETGLEELMMAYELTTGHLSAKTERQAAKLWRSMAEGYIDWMEHHGSKDILNWSSHRVKLGVMAAYETGDARLEARGAAVFRDHLKLNMRDDGSVEDFYTRDALHYVAYDLEPLEMAALVAKRHGQDWFHTGDRGRTLARGVDWFVPYETGEKTHEEFVHSRSSFDAARDHAGEKGYSGPWDPANGVNTLALAVLLDARFASALEQTVKQTGHDPWLWTQLLPGK
jgi:hypothetical protein